MNNMTTHRKASENHLEGRNAVLEAFRSGQTVDKLFLQAGLQDGMIMTIAREAREAGTGIRLHVAQAAPDFPFSQGVCFRSLGGVFGSFVLIFLLQFCRRRTGNPAVRRGSGE